MQSAQELLEGLTPGGSEFAGDPEVCAAYVRDRLTALENHVKRLVKTRAEVVAQEREATMALLERVANHYRCLAQAERKKSITDFSPNEAAEFHLVAKVLQEQVAAIRARGNQ